MIEKRKNPTLKEQDMYKISDIDTFIEEEQRKDELDRLYEVKAQKKVWQRVVFACLFLNLILVIFAIMGYIENV